MRPVEVLVLTRYGRMGASSRQRFLLFQELLLAEGFALRIRPFFPDGYLANLYDRRSPGVLEIAGCYAGRLRVLLQRSSHDIVWLEKEALPWLPAWLENLLLGSGVRIVDFDDGWHLKYRGADAP